MAEKSHPEAPAEGLTQAKNEVPVYEVGFHLIPTISEEAVSSTVEKIRSVLKSAEVISEQFPARMPLAYTVERSVQGKREKYTESYFGFIKFAAEREVAPALTEALRGMKEILRFIVISTSREDAPNPRHAVFASARLEGETIKKPEQAPEKPAEVSEEELDKSIDALVS